MKKTILIFTIIMSCVFVHAQQTPDRQLQPIVLKLDNAAKSKDYEQLANEFLQIANAQKTNWLSWYYAAFCNAKVGWLKQDDPDNIEPFANKADEQIKKAIALLDTATLKKELSEVYCVLMMLNQARVFINPETYGPRYGPGAFNYTQLAKQANADNPRMLYLLGWQKFATPKMFGGDKALAKELLTQARQKLEAQSTNDVNPHWGKKEVEELLKQIK